MVWNLEDYKDVSTAQVRWRVQASKVVGVDSMFLLKKCHTAFTSETIDLGKFDQSNHENLFLFIVSAKVFQVQLNIDHLQLSNDQASHPEGPSSKTSFTPPFASFECSTSVPPVLRQCSTPLPPFHES